MEAGVLALVRRPHVDRSPPRCSAGLGTSGSRSGSGQPHEHRWPIAAQRARTTKEAVPPRLLELAGRHRRAPQPCLYGRRVGICATRVFPRLRTALYRDARSVVDRSNRTRALVIEDPHLLWGTFVAGIISVIVNTGVALTLGEAVAAVASAPIIEEITKGLGIVWMVRRKEVDGPMDGIVYAGWSALGFAMIENMNFFLAALEGDMLVEVFIGRALFTPFAHPLFTMWTGLAIGLAVRARKSTWSGLWGLGLAMALHAAWNGALTFSEATDSGLLVIGVAILLFVSLFIASGVGIVILRRRDQRRYQQLVPFLASRYNMSQAQVALLLDPAQHKAVRANMTDKAQVRQFKMASSAMVRLAALLDHDDMPPPEDEARLYSQLVAAHSQT